MRAVYKYELARGAGTPLIVLMPAGATALRFDFQGETPCIWALVDPREEEATRRHFVIAGTGHRFDGDGAMYIGTAFVASLVFHAFEVFVHAEETT